MSNSDNHNSNFLGKPTTKVIVRGIDMFITTEDLNTAAQNFKPISITPQPPPYQELAIITFPSSIQSRAFVEQRPEPGSATIKGKSLYLDYLQPTEDLSVYISAGTTRRVRKFTDWVCKNCKYKNFARREICHLCKVPREIAEQKPVDDRPISLARKFSADTMHCDIFRYGIFAKEVLAVTKVPAEIEKDNIRYTFAPVAAVKAVSLRRPKGYRPVAFVEFNSREEARLVLEHHKKKPFLINGEKVEVFPSVEIPSRDKKVYEIRLAMIYGGDKVKSKYRGGDGISRRFDDDLMRYSHTAGKSYRVSRKNRRKVDERYRNKEKERRRSRCSFSSDYDDYSSEKNEKEQKKEQKQTIEKSEEQFQYDPSSGFYYDKKSGYLFDPITQIYCHYQTRHLFLWNETKKTFEPTKKAGRFGYLVNPLTAGIPSGVITPKSVKIINSVKVKKTVFKIPIKAPSFKSRVNPLTSKDRKPKNVKLNEKRPQRFSKFGRIARQASNLKDMAKAEKIGHGVALGHEEVDNPLETSRRQVISDMKRNDYIGNEGLNSNIKQSNNVGLNEVSLEFGGRKDFFDYKRIACLLCKRGFKSLEVMKRHAKESLLHKKNLRIFEVKKAAMSKVKNMNKSVMANKNRKTNQKGVISFFKLVDYIFKFWLKNVKNDTDRRHEKYRSNMKEKVKERYLTSDAPIFDRKSGQNTQNSNYTKQMEQFNSQNCNDKIQSFNALIK